MANIELDSSKSLHQMASNGPMVYLHLVLDGDNQSVTEITPNVQRIFGHSPEQFLSGELPLFSYIHEEDYEEFMEILTKRITSKIPFWESSFRVYSSSGEVKSVKVYSYIDYESKNEGTSIHAYLFDQTYVKEKIKTNISLEHQRWATAIDSAREGVWDLKPQTNEIYFSKHWKGMLGYEEHEFPNEFDEWTKRVHPDDLEETELLITQHIQNETDYYESKHRLLHKDGTYRWILDRGKAVERDENGIAIRMIGTHVDITEQIEMKHILRKRNEELERLVEQMKELSITDPLTSLYNRRKMMDEIKRARMQFDVHEQPFTIAILDLDFFKQINDKYGHTFGDIALQTFANLLKRKIASPNVIARWGGEEFILLFPNKSKIQTQYLLSSLQACCNEELLKYRTESVMLTFSAGVCEYNDCNLRDDIIKKADQALYAAKSLGRNQIIFYKEELPTL